MSVEFESKETTPEMVEIEASRLALLQEAYGLLLKENLGLKKVAQKGEVIDRVFRVRDRIINFLMEEHVTVEEFGMALALMTVPIFEQMLAVVGVKAQQALGKQKAATGAVAGEDDKNPFQVGMKNDISGANFEETKKGGV